MPENDTGSSSGTPPANVADSSTDGQAAALKPDEPFTTKDRVTLTIAAIGAVLGLINSAIVVSNYITTARTAERTTQLEAERDLDAAWDLLASNQYGAGAARMPEAAPVQLREASPEQRERARRLLRDVLIRDPQNVRARNLLAWYFEASSNWQAAIDIRRALVSEQPDDPERVWALANSLISSQRWDEAISVLELSIAKHPDPNLLGLLSTALWGKRGAQGITEVERASLEQRAKGLDERQRHLRAASARTSGGNITFGPNHWRMAEWRVVRAKDSASIVGTAVNNRDQELKVTVDFLVYDEADAYLGEFRTAIGPIAPHSATNFELRVPAMTTKAYFSGVGW